MRLKKNVLRLLSCVAVMAAMVMLLLTGCDGGGEAPSSPAESNGTAGSNASSSSAASSESSSSSGSSSSTNTANKATKLLLYTTGTIDADYVDDMDGYVTHYRCAVRGDDIYSVNYQDSGEAYITVLKKGDDYYMIEGNCATKTTETSVYKGYKQDKIEMRGDRAEMSDFPLYLNTVAGGLDCRDQTIGGFSFVVKIYALPVVEIIG